MPSAIASDRFPDRAGQAVVTAGLIKCVELPFVVPLSRISVVQQIYGLPFTSSIRQIYEEDARRSIRNFFKSTTPHCLKEASHLTSRAIGFAEKPRLDAYFHSDPYGQIKSDLTFAGTLTTTEMLIHPLDTIRTRWQSGQYLFPEENKRISCLYKGAISNGARQFIVWLGFPVSERICSNVIEKTTAIDPHTHLGIALKALPQSAQITSSFWVFERLKTELQCRPDLTIGNSRKYQAAWKHIIRTQGYGGLIRGFPIKVASNAFPIAGANYLIETSRKWTNTAR